MKRDLLLASIALVMAAAGCTPPEPSKPSEPEAPAPAAEASGQDATIDAPPMPLAGGYAPASLEDPQVKEASDLAIAEIYKRDPTRALVETVTAEVQVVAGLNYSFRIRMSGGATYDVVVFRNLQNELSVTDYQKAG